MIRPWMMVAAAVLAHPTATANPAQAPAAAPAPEAAAAQARPEPPLVAPELPRSCDLRHRVPEPSRQRPAAPDETAQDIWESRCAMCHGRSGDAKTAMGRRYSARDFTDPRWQATTTDADVRCVIRLGIPNTPMRAFQGHLTEAQIEALLKIIRGLGQQRPAATAAVAPL